MVYEQATKRAYRRTHRFQNTSRTFFLEPKDRGPCSVVKIPTARPLAGFDSGERPHNLVMVIESQVSHEK